MPTLKAVRAQVVAVHERGIELDRTIFYPMGGGQLGAFYYRFSANSAIISRPLRCAWSAIFQQMNQAPHL